MKRVRAKFTYSNVISSICLVLLLGGGTAYAASQLGKESIGSRQLAKEAVTPAKLNKAAKQTLTGPTGATGATGAQGPQGPKGDKGDTGAPGNANVVTFSFGSHNFATDFEERYEIPGITYAEMSNDIWQAKLEAGTFSYPLPGPGQGGNSKYRPYLENAGSKAFLLVNRYEGPGETVKVSLVVAKAR